MNKCHMSESFLNGITNCLDDYLYTNTNNDENVPSDTFLRHK